tara:strand:+ start:1729 stop:1848 length:120 start_codon:yes stop_codon:yes gene_type:complete
VVVLVLKAVIVIVFVDLKTVDLTIGDVDKVFLAVSNCVV